MKIIAINVVTSIFTFICDILIYDSDVIANVTININRADGGVSKTVP